MITTKIKQSLSAPIKGEEQESFSLIRISDITTPDFAENFQVDRVEKACLANLSQSTRDGIENHFKKTGRNIPFVLTCVYMLGFEMAKKLSVPEKSPVGTLPGIPVRGGAFSPTNTPALSKLPVGVAPAVKPAAGTASATTPQASKYPILEKYQTLKGNERTAFWDKNKSELIAEMRAAHAENQSR